MELKMLAQLLDPVAAGALGNAGGPAFGGPARSGAARQPARSGAEINSYALLGELGTDRGSVEFEFKDVRVICSNEVACVQGFVRIGGAGTTAGWTRRTVGLRRHGDGWKVVHEHTSAPFSGAAA